MGRSFGSPTSWQDFISQCLIINSDISALKYISGNRKSGLSAKQPKSNDQMDWEATNNNMNAITSGNKTSGNRPRAKWVSKETLAFRKANVTAPSRPRAMVTCGHVRTYPVVLYLSRARPFVLV